MEPALERKSIGSDQKTLLKKESSWFEEPRIRLGTKVHFSSRIQFGANQSKLVPRKLDPGPSSKVCILQCIKRRSVSTSVGRFFEFLKNHQFQFFKYCRIKELSVRILWKTFKTKELAVMVISKTSKNPKFAWNYRQRPGSFLAPFFDFLDVLRKHGYILISVLWFCVCNCQVSVYTWVDNWQVSVPHFKNHATLLSPPWRPAAKFSM
jgi:hypothetical protein